MIDIVWSEMTRYLVAAAGLRAFSFNAETLAAFRHLGSVSGQKKRRQQNIREYVARRIPILPELIRWLMLLMYNSANPAQCAIGKDRLFECGGIGVVLYPECKIGGRVLSGQGVMLGGPFGSGPPTIEIDVEIGPGARILGDITIGPNSVIGANAVVIRDVPENSVVGRDSCQVNTNNRAGSACCICVTLA